MRDPGGGMRLLSLVIPDERAPIGRWAGESARLAGWDSNSDARPDSTKHPTQTPRAATLPEVEYPPGSVQRKVAGTGDISWRCARLLVGRGRTGQWVRVEEANGEVILRYATHELRRVPVTPLGSGGRL